MDNIQNLIMKLNDNNHEIRKRAAIELGKIKSPRALSPLINQIYRENYFYKIKRYKYNISEFLFSAINEIGPQSIHYLIYELIDSPDEIFYEYLKIIKSYEEKGYKMLLDIFETENDPSILIDIITVWIIIKEERAFNKMKHMLKSNNYKILRCSSLYFLQFGDKGKKILKKEFYRYKNQIIENDLAFSDDFKSFLKDLWIKLE